MKNIAILVALGALVVSIIGLVHSMQTSKELEAVNAASQRTKLLTKINEVEIIAGKIAYSMEKMDIVCAHGDSKVLGTTNRIKNNALEREKELRQFRLAYSNYQEPIEYQVIEKRLSEVEVSRQNHQVLFDLIEKLDEDICK